MSSFQLPKKRQRISPIAHFSRRQRPVKRIPSSLLKLKSSVGGTEVSLCHISVKPVEVPTPPSQFNRPPKSLATSVSNISYVTPPPGTRKRTASSIVSASDQRPVKRPRTRESELRVYRKRTTFFSLPIELRQAVLIQALDFTELHDSAKQFGEQRQAQPSTCYLKRPSNFDLCFDKYLGERKRLTLVLFGFRNEPNMPIDGYSWHFETKFVFEKWAKNIHKSIDYAYH